MPKGHPLEGHRFCSISAHHRIVPAFASHVVVIQRRSLSVALSVQTHVWPEATFQWMKDGVDIDGATGGTLTVDLACKPDFRLTQFRCKNCRRIDKSVPANAYETICSYCGFVTTSPEIWVKFVPPWR